MKSPPITPMHGGEKKYIINESRKRKRSNEQTSQTIRKEAAPNNVSIKVPFVIMNTISLACFC